MNQGTGYFSVISTSKIHCTCLLSVPETLEVSFPFFRDLQPRYCLIGFRRFETALWSQTFEMIPLYCLAALRTYYSVMLRRTLETHKLQLHSRHELKVCITLGICVLSFSHVMYAKVLAYSIRHNYSNLKIPGTYTCTCVRTYVRVCACVYVRMYDIGTYVCVNI
jgi:hypothetical protein